MCAVSKFLPDLLVPKESFLLWVPTKSQTFQLVFRHHICLQIWHHLPMKCNTHCVDALNLHCYYVHCTVPNCTTLNQKYSARWPTVGRVETMAAHKRGQWRGNDDISHNGNYSFSNKHQSVRVSCRAGKIIFNILKIWKS